MERKRCGLFAVLLMVVMMVTAVLSMPAGVYAMEKDRKVNIEVDSKTSDSITLKVEDGYIYAIQVKENDEFTWMWAEDKQYVKDEKTQKVTKVTFSGLEADTEYVFGKRLEKDEVDEDKIITQQIKTATKENPVTTKATEATTEPMTEATEPVTGATEPTTEATVPTTEATKLTAEVTMPAMKTTESATEPETRATEPATKTTEPTTGVKEPTTEETEPPVKARESKSAQVSKHEKMAETPVKKAVTDVSITLETAETVPQEGNKVLYGLYISDGEIQWKEDGVFGDLTQDTEYKFVLGEFKGKDAVALSEPTTIKTLSAAAAAPNKPAMSARTETTITLASIENGEYGIVQADAVAESDGQISAQSEENILWQGSPEFTGLNPNTEYLFKVRVKFDAETAMESIASESVMYKTLLPFEGSTITGVAVDGAYESGTKLTAAAVGNGMDNVNPAEGDSRWIPRTWNWGEGKDVLDQWKDGYTIPFTLVEVGNYRLSVEFEREEYTGGTWKATNVFNTVVIPFKVTAAPVTVYTITATAGANGTISPQGNVTVANGNSVEFTFKPNNGYKVSKVYVDGYEVEVSNNKYAFKGVDANHTISVTFEQARKIDSPRTGDRMNMTLGIVILIVSAVLLIGIVVYNQGKKKR